MTELRPHLPVACFLLAVVRAAGAEDSQEPRFEDVATRAGLDFVHEHGGSGQKYLVETMGSGACFLDYDLDGDPDLFLPQGAPLPGFQDETMLRNSLYRNEGVDPDGQVRFRDVTDVAGVGDQGWGMGCAAADIDGDGDADLLVTNFGPDLLFRNNGDGRFTDVTDTAGVGDPRWSASAAFADADGDGDLDLYVTHYVDFTVETHQVCGTQFGRQSSYCHPEAYTPVPDSFYRNRGDGTFEEANEAFGQVAAGNGLGVVWSDFDNDSRIDLYVANDSSPNFLFLNRGEGRFREVGLLHGVAVNEDGRTEAGMGIEVADFDGDGLQDIFVTHLDMETNTLYRNMGRGRFVDWSRHSGIGVPSFLSVGFGVVSLDYDLDGDLDLLVANGHVLDDVEDNQWTSVTYAQPMHLLENDGTGRFRETGKRHGAALSEPLVGRGLAIADVDADGDLDALVTATRDRVRLLLVQGSGGSWVQFDLRQPGGNRLGIGASLSLEAGGRQQHRELRAGASYLSQNSITAHFGLGSASGPFTMTARWPDGARQSVRGLAAQRRYLLHRAPGLARSRTPPGGGTP